MYSYLPHLANLNFDFFSQILFFLSLLAKEYFVAYSKN